MRIFHFLSFLSLFSVGCQKKQSLNHLEQLNDLCPVSAYNSSPSIPLVQVDTNPNIPTWNRAIWIDQETIHFDYDTITEMEELLASLEKEHEIETLKGNNPTLSLAVSPKTNAVQLINIIDLVQKSGFTNRKRSQLVENS